MKKHLILAIALLVTVFSFAQKKEIKALEKAIKNSNFAEAKALVGQLEPMLGSLDDKLKSKYVLNAAKAFFANGSNTTEDIAKVTEILSSVGEESSPEISQLKRNIENDLITKANDLYTSKDFLKAAVAFESLYNVNKKEEVYLYYAAVSALNVQDMDGALKYYLKLNELGYTGVKTEYFATNKANGEVQNFDKATRNKYVKIGTHEKPGERITESKVSEITKNIALIYASKGENDKALAAMKQARDANPDDSTLLIDEANIHYKLGNNEKYEELIQTALQNDPNNPELLYNLGVLANNSGNKTKAKDYYKKALNLKPDDVNTLINLAQLVLSEEQEIVKVMNGLGTSSADNKKYDELKAKRTNIYSEAVPYLEKVLELQEDSREVGITLANIYSAIGEDAKAKALREKFN